MDLDQVVEIPLSEYLELKEIKDHAKEVKIEEIYHYKHDDKSYDHQGSSIYWKSDGKCWVHLTEKLSKQSLVVKELVKDKKELESKVRKLEWNIEDMRLGKLLKNLLSKDKGDDNV